MNRVIIGAITVLVVAGIIVLVARSASSLNIGKLFQRPVPKSGTLKLAGVSASPSSNPQFSPVPLGTSTPGASPTSATQSAFPRVSAAPSPSVLPISGGGQLPATGL